MYYIQPINENIVFYVYICDTNEIRLKTAMLQLPVISTLKILTESGSRFFDIGRYIFQGSRVFDGRYGRFNLVVVNFWAYAGRIIMFQLLVRSDLRYIFITIFYTDILMRKVDLRLGFFMNEMHCLDTC